MTQRMLGLETEYGLSVPNGGRGHDQGECAHHLLLLAARRYPHLPAACSSGLFMGNGARFYIDSGSHPEMCTPEVEDPWELVRYACAGDEILQQLACDAAAATGMPAPAVFKNNLDYRTGATWACHENYGHRANPQVLPEQLIPHLVTRILYTGGGGLNPFAPGIELCLSPRVHHLVQSVGGSSTGGRGIFHTKDETLSALGWHRMHVLCGESLCSHLAAWLKCGTTALVVALAETGLRPGERMRFRDPLEAMRRFNSDLTCRATAELQDGRAVTALDVQRHYLEFAESRLDGPYFPSWAPRVCELWRDILNRLENSLAGVSGRLDWAIKHTLYIDHARRRGFAPQEFPALNKEVAVRGGRRAAGPSIELLTQLAAAGAPLDLVQEELPAPVPSKRLDARARAFLQLRTELCELELRFSQLGPSSLFASLDHAGLLQHGLPEITPATVCNAICEPPAVGRAHWRGQSVRRWSGKNGYRCDWHGVWNGHGEVLDLTDPLQREMPDWRKDPSASPIPPLGPIERLLEHAKHEYDRGNYDQARNYLNQFARTVTPRSHPSFHWYSVLTAWVEARRGFYPLARAALDELASVQPMAFSLALDYTTIYRLQGLAPGPEALDWVRRTDELLARTNNPDPVEVLGFRSQKGAVLRHAGQLEAAREILTQATQDTPRRQSNPRMMARTLADLAETHRLLGDRPTAKRLLEDAEALQARGNFGGELADYTLPFRAKLEVDLAAARGYLERAELMQIAANNRMGLARTLLLKVRLAGNSAEPDRTRQRLQELRGGIPSLRDCPLFGKILSGWDDWCAGKQLATEPDQFWGL